MPNSFPKLHGASLVKVKPQETLEKNVECDYLDLKDICC